MGSMIHIHHQKDFIHNTACCGERCDLRMTDRDMNKYCSLDLDLLKPVNNVMAPGPECPGRGIYTLVDLEVVKETREVLGKPIEIGESLKVSAAGNRALLDKLPEVPQ